MPIHEEKQNIVKKHRLRLAANTVKNVIRATNNQGQPMLGLEELPYRLEKWDPKHRRAQDIIAYYYAWEKTDTHLNFFTWLDQEEESTNSPLSRTVMRETHEAQNCFKISFIDGCLYQNGEICDTRQNNGKHPGRASFVTSKKNELFLEDQQHHQSAHSSFLAGARVAGAGTIRIEDGKVTLVNNYSGHYKPLLRNLLYSVQQIPLDCFAAKARVVYQTERFPKVGEWLRASTLYPLRLLGRLLGQFRKEVSQSPAKFIESATAIVAAETRPAPSSEIYQALRIQRSAVADGLARRAQELALSAPQPLSPSDVAQLQKQPFESKEAGAEIKQPNQPSIKVQ